MPAGLLAHEMKALKDDDVKHLAAAGRRLHAGGMVPGTMGVAGIRLHSGAIAVSAEGSRLSDLDRTDIVLLDDKGRSVSGSQIATRDSWLLHAVLNARPEAGCVIRVHAPYTTVLSHRGRKFLERWNETLEHIDGIAFVPYYRPGTAGLAGAVAESLRENRVTLIEKQGAVVWGVDPDEAADTAEMMEAAARLIFLLASQNGRRQ